MDHNGIQPLAEPLRNPLTASGAVILMLIGVCVACGFVVLALAYGLWRVVSTLSHRPGDLRAAKTLPDHRCVQV